MLVGERPAVAAAPSPLLRAEGDLLWALKQEADGNAGAAADRIEAVLPQLRTSLGASAQLVTSPPHHTLDGGAELVGQRQVGAPDHQLLVDDHERLEDGVEGPLPLSLGDRDQDHRLLVELVFRVAAHKAQSTVITPSTARSRA